MDADKPHLIYYKMQTKLLIFRWKIKDNQLSSPN